METSSVEYVFDVVSKQLPSAGVDFLKIDPHSMDELMESAEEIDYCGYRLNVPGILDLIAMKLFAVAHGSLKREDKDLTDVINLAHGCGMEFELLRELCDRYANDEVYSKLEHRMGGEEPNDEISNIRKCRRTSSTQHDA